MKMTRRSALSGIATTLLAGCMGQKKFPDADYDCVIVGAGAAGIAAGRYLHDRGKRVVLLEARPRIGGRTLTDTASWGLPFDHGASWLHSFYQNPLKKRLDPAEVLYSTSTSNGALYQRGFVLDEASHVAYAAAESTLYERIAKVARSGKDTSLNSIAGGDVWVQRVVDIASSATTAAPPSEASAIGLSSRLREDDRLPASGVGTLIARQAVGLPVQLDAPVQSIDPSGLGLVVDTPRGRLSARSCIVTVPVSLLARNAIGLSSGLGDQVAEAFGKLGMGVYEKVAFRLKARPPTSEDFRVGFSEVLNNRPHGLSLHPVLPIVTILYGAQWASEIGNEGRSGRIAFGESVLRDVFGSGIAAEIDGEAIVTDWEHDPWSLGGYSYLRASHTSARQAYETVFDERLAFTGEAASTTAPATVGGAWGSGEAAAKRIARYL